MRRLVALVPMAALATACGSQQSGPVSNSYASAPDLRPPVVTVGTPARDTAPGYVFFAPKKDLPQSGPLIVDNRGHQGNVQKLPDGHVFVGFGGLPYFTEFAEDGKVIFDAHFPASGDSYRAYRFPWVGRPAGRPSVAYAGRKVYASWNGATEIAGWWLLAGDRPDKLRPLGWWPRTGFETSMTTPKAETYIAVVAVNRNADPVGTSEPVSQASFDFGPRLFAGLRG